MQPGSKITVRVYNYAEVPREVLAQAEMEVTRIFRDVAVETVWLDCPLSPTESQSLPACPQNLGPTELALRILFRNKVARSSFPESWLGYAIPPGEKNGRMSHASVFYDRVVDLARDGPAEHYQILGHAMAHEMGHLMLGSDRHSNTGLMRGRWDARDLQRAAQGLLLFTSDEAGLMRAEVLARTAEQDQISRLAATK